MIGNEAAKRTISTIFETISSTGEVTFPFLIVEGDDGSGVLAYMEKQIQELVGGFSQDVLFLRDMAEELGKKSHALKVDVDSKDQVIDSEKYGPVANIGAREISNRLSRAPAGKVKIVFIEHIQRMTLSAANALLKSFEEPLPGRLIIGTTQNAGALMDTIVSRAMVIGVQNPVLASFLQEHFVSTDDKKQVSQAIALVGFDKVKIDALLEENVTLEAFAVLEHDVLEGGLGYKIAAAVKELGKKWTHFQLLDALLFQAEKNGKYERIHALSKAKKMISANVNADHVWFGLGG